MSMTHNAFDEALFTWLGDNPIIAVLVIDELDSAVPLAQALFDGGVRAVELTLRTPVAMAAVRHIREALPDMRVGLGTVLTPQQVVDGVAAGAAFGVAPGLNRSVLAAAREHGFSFAPGIVTPSEIETAIECGCRLMKFFPAEVSGGLGYLRSMAGPYAHLDLSFIPLGGLNETNVASYLADPLVHAVGGSWIAPRSLIKARDWTTIRERAAVAVAAGEAR